MSRTTLAARLAAVPAAVLAVGISLALPSLRTPAAQGSPAPSAVVPAESWPETSPEPPPGPSAGSAALRAVRLLQDWHDRRSEAYSTGDVAALRRLYVPGSEAGRRDCRMLVTYARRGVVLRLRTHTSGLSVLVARPGHVVVRQQAVVRAVARIGRQERALPSSRPQWRRVVLGLVEGRWLVSAATPEPAGSPREPP